MNRRCEFCGSQLSPLSPPNKRYCDTRCRMADFRRKPTLQAREALEILREPEPVSERAQMAMLASPHRDMYGKTWRDRLAYLAEHSPLIVETFGMSVLTAAAAPLPMGTCRWHPVLGAGIQVQNNKSTRMLLGDPCRECDDALTASAHNDDCRWLPLIRRTLARRAHGEDAPTPTVSGELMEKLGPPCRLCVNTLQNLSSGRRSTAGTRHPARPSDSSSSVGRGASLSASADGPCCNCVTSGGGFHWPECDTQRSRSSLVAHAWHDGERPPRAVFDDPRFTARTPIIVSDGRVYGHLGGRVPNADSFDHFLTGEVTCRDGTRVRVGVIAAGNGENTRDTVAVVTCGTDRFGTWIAGHVPAETPHEFVRRMTSRGITADVRRNHLYGLMIEGR